VQPRRPLHCERFIPGGSVPAHKSAFFPDSDSGTGTRFPSADTEDIAARLTTFVASLHVVVTDQLIGVIGVIGVIGAGDTLQSAVSRRQRCRLSVPIAPVAHFRCPICTPPCGKNDRVLRRLRDGHHKNADCTARPDKFPNFARRPATNGTMAGFSSAG
jgi:hypothetical protein